MRRSAVSARPQRCAEEMSKEQQELLGALAQRMMAVIEKYAKDNGYSLDA